MSRNLPDPRISWWNKKVNLMNCKRQISISTVWLLHHPTWWLSNSISSIYLRKGVLIQVISLRWPNIFLIWIIKKRQTIWETSSTLDNLSIAMLMTLNQVPPNLSKIIAHLKWFRDMLRDSELKRSKRKSPWQELTNQMRPLDCLESLSRNKQNQFMLFAQHSMKNYRFLL